MHKKLYRFRLKIERYRRVRLPRRIKKVKKASRHPYAVPVITIGVLLILSVTGLLIANRHHKPSVHPYVVIISYSNDHAQEVVPSIEPTVGALLDKLHVTLNQRDVVQPSLSTRINQDKFRINIYRAL